MLDNDEVIIYHNPRCSKSRQALQLLRDRGVTLRVIEYLKTPPAASELAALLDLLGLEPRQLMRTQERSMRPRSWTIPALTGRP